MHGTRCGLTLCNEMDDLFVKELDVVVGRVLDNVSPTRRHRRPVRIRHE